MEAAADELLAEMAAHLAHLVAAPRQRRPRRTHRAAGLVPAAAEPAAARPAGASTRRHRRRCAGWCSRCTSGATTATAGSATSTSARRRALTYAAVDYRTRRRAGASARRLPAFAGAAGGLGRRLAADLAGVDPSRDAVVDVATWHDGEAVDIAETAKQVGECLNACAFGRALQRIELALTAGAQRRRRTSVSFVGDGRGRLRREPAVPRPAPDAGQAAGDLAPAQLPARAAAGARGRATCSSASRTTTRRTGGCSRWPRSAISMP